MISFRLKACVKCRGDLVLDEGDWLCLQCGTYYYTGLYRPAALPCWPREEPERRSEETKTSARVTEGSPTGPEAFSAVPDLLRPAPAAGIQQIADPGSLALHT